MPQFRKKPIVIEAFKWTVDEVPEWWVELVGVTVNVSTGSAFIPTLEGTMEAMVNDYIIQGVNGEVYPCKPDIFEKTYESASVLQDKVKNKSLNKIKGSLTEKYKEMVAIVNDEMII